VTLAATAPDWSRNSGNSGLRWWVLVLAAIAVSSSYYEDDVIGPIADLLHRQRGFTQSQLGMLNGVIRIPNVALALISGLMIDRYGPARIALWAAAIGPLTFMVLGLTDLSLWVSTVMMGISFSLVPAVIWPATTLIVEPRRLGTALGLITLIQALGMAASNLAAG
jgi:MFS family permease